MDTSANLPFCNAGPTSGTKLPSRTPRTMARRIQRARKRSSQPRDLKAEVFLASGGVSCASCFSASPNDREAGESSAVFAGMTAGSLMGCFAILAKIGARWRCPCWENFLNVEGEGGMGVGCGAVDMPPAQCLLLLLASGPNNLRAGMWMRPGSRNFAPPRSGPIISGQ